MNQVVKRENESFTELTDSGFLYSELPSTQWHIGNCHLAFKTGLRTCAAATYDRYPIGRTIAFSHGAVE